MNIKVTNFTIFDREYFEALFGDKTFPDGSYMIDFEEEFINYEKAFMKVVSKIRETNMMTFPVLTFSLLRVDGKFVDEEFARFAVQHNMKWSIWPVCLFSANQQGRICG